MWLAVALHEPAGLSPSQLALASSVYDGDRFHLDLFGEVPSVVRSGGSPIVERRLAEAAKMGYNVLSERAIRPASERSVLAASARE